MICSNCKRKGKHSTTVTIDNKVYYLCDQCAFYIYEILERALKVSLNGHICFNFTGEKERDLS